MNWETLLNISFFMFVAATVIYMLYAARLVKQAVRYGYLIAAIGCGLELVGMIMRYREGDYVPLSNTYEVLVFFSWCMVAIYLVIEKIYKIRAVGAFVMPLALISLGIASLLPERARQLEPLVPALQSQWLTFHVVTCFISYAALAVAFSVSLMYLFLLKREKNLKSADEKYTSSRFLWVVSGGIAVSFGLLSWLIRGAMAGVVVVIAVAAVGYLLRLVAGRWGARQGNELEQLGDLNYKMVTFGVLLLGLGIISGAMWANSAWGRYWGWDPKETWSLITWLYYLTILHLRFAYGVSRTRMAVFSLIGLFLVVFTFIGVNYLLSGLHAYG
jgi:cytochrome c-type biogenesis protein CcsB